MNAPLWSDGAAKERYLALPGDGKIEFDAIFFPDSATGRGPHGWKFPDGSVLVKTFFLDLEKGNPARRVRLETRILHHRRLVGTEEVGDQFWAGYTYLWDDDQADATLLESPTGLDRTYTIRDPAAPGGTRRQTWHFPSRAECMLCHTMPAKFVLGVNTLQMNRDFDYGGVVDNQLRAWEHAGLFTKPLPAPPEKLPGLVDYADKTKDLDRRARSYLHANCSHCHRAFGGGNANFQLLATLGLDEMGIVDVPPGQGTHDIPDARIVLPGDPGAFHDRPPDVDARRRADAHAGLDRWWTSRGWSSSAPGSGRCSGDASPGDRGSETSAAYAEWVDDAERQSGTLNCGRVRCSQWMGISTGIRTAGLHRFTQ